MIGALVVYAAVVTACVGGAAALVASIRERSGASTRWVWFVALVSVVGLVASAPLRVGPAARAIELPVSAVESVTATGSDAMPWHVRAAVLRARMADRIAAPMRMASALPLAVTRVVAGAWLVSAAVVAGIFALAFLGMHRRRARWPHAMVDGVPVRVTDGVGPLVVGVATPEIVLPPWIVALDQRARALVLAHEAEHQRARDPLLLAVGALAVVLVPWHPATWWMLRRLGAAIEMDCDARVLGRGVAARDYGLLLLDIASRSRPRSLLTPWPTLGVSSHLERRLIAMTTRPMRPSMARAATVLVSATALLLVACESKLPTSAELEAMDGKRAVAGAQLLLADSTRPTVFEVDGRRVTKAQFVEIPAAEIASLDIEKRADASVMRVRRRTGASMPPSAEIREVVIDSAAPATRRDGGALIERPVAASGDSTRVRVRVVGSGAPVEERPLATQERRFDGLLVIDGEVRPADEMRALRPDLIERVEVVKGPAAQTGRFATDPRAANGIIYIYTKGAAAKP
jgi:beta-lactamase regulating signal transducer with metallopeptidase domain